MWPGAVHFPDFLNPETHRYWAEQLREFRRLAPWDGVWIDMNEPSNFCTGDICTSEATPGGSTDCGLSCAYARSEPRLLLARTPHRVTPPAHSSLEEHPPCLRVQDAHEQISKAGAPVQHSPASREELPLSRSTYAASAAACCLLFRPCVRARSVEQAARRVNNSDLSSSAGERQDLVGSVSTLGSVFEGSRLAKGPTNPPCRPLQHSTPGPLLRDAHGACMQAAKSRAAVDPCMTASRLSSGIACHAPAALRNVPLCAELRCWPLAAGP